MYNNYEHNAVGLNPKSIWDTLDLYLKDKIYFLNIYKRTHKLCAAIFLVSNNIENADALKSKIGDLCIRMLSVTVNLKDSPSHVEVHKLLFEIENCSLQIISFLDIASISGFVSIMNTDIIKNEFNTILIDLNKFKVSWGNKESAVVDRVLSVGRIQNGLDAVDSVSDNILEKDLYIKDNNIEKDHLVNNKRQNRKSTRKSLIYEFILKHKNSSIKDIVPNIKGCSEKTVQREITDLIKEGRVTKMGERRWSKYSTG